MPCHNGCEEAASLLVAAGADPSLHDPRLFLTLPPPSPVPSQPSPCTGIAPLMLAAQSGCEEAVSPLMAAGADPFPLPPNPCTGITPLMLAAQNGCEEAVSLLVAAGANPDTLNPQGKSALDLARSPAVKHILKAASTQQSLKLAEQQVCVGWGMTVWGV